MSSGVESRDVSSTKVLDEGVISSSRLSGGHPSKGFVGSTEEIVVGERGEDAVIILVLDKGRSGAGELEAHTVDHPLGLNALEIGDTRDSLKGDGVVNPHSAQLGPLLLGARVLVDKSQGTSATVNFETVLLGSPR